MILQGQQLHDFYGVLKGRFALVESNGNARRQGTAQFLAQAKLVKVIESQGIFGEFGALMDTVQPYSVFALEPGIVEPVSTQVGNLHSCFSTKPHYGVKICTSFAGRLKKFLVRYSLLTEEENRLERILQNAARAYLAVVNELSLTGGGNESAEASFARSKEAFSFSKALLKPTTETHTHRSSVSSAVVRAPTDSVEPRVFSPGTLICKKGMLGDRLFIIKRGTVEVQLGGKTIIEISQPGSIIGEIAVFLNLAQQQRTISRTADVVCKSEVEAIIVGIDQVQDFFSQQPNLMTGLLHALVERTKETSKLIEQAHEHLKTLLYQELSVLLEGHHEVAHYLSARHDGLKFRHPLQLTAHQSRLIYDDFRKSLEVLN